MKLTRNELLEKINNLNKQKPLSESKEIQRVSAPADADALEQHKEALKKNKERLDPKNYDQDVKDLIKDTASEESRYNHFDVVDRKELAKRINEAKEKGLDFKVSRSAKKGFRYNLEVLNEEFMKKEAGDPILNCSAFNKATDIQASSPSNGLGEDVEKTPEIEEPESVKEEIDYKGLVSEICSWLANNEDIEGVSFPLIDHLVAVGYGEDFVNSLFEKCDEESKADYEAEELEDIEAEFPLDENLDEELKVYTSTLEGFHPSVNCEDFWKEIVDNDKVEDLEYALETLYPDGISDIALDDLLSHEEDWIRDIIELPFEESDEDDNDSEEPILPEDEDELVDDDLDEVDSDLDVESDDDVEPIDIKDDEIEYEHKKEVKEESLENKCEDTKEKIIECDEDDEKVEALADGFVNKNFKENTCCVEDPKAEVKKQLTESEESDDEIIDISSDDVDNMLGCPKK